MNKNSDPDKNFSSPIDLDQVLLKDSRKSEKAIIEMVKNSKEYELHFCELLLKKGKQMLFETLVKWVFATFIFFFTWVFAPLLTHILKNKWFR